MLKLLEEVGVLDGDNRLVGEGLQKLKLKFGESGWRVVDEIQDPDGIVPGEERREGGRAPAGSLCKRLAFCELRPHRVDVVDVHGSAFQDSAPSEGAGHDRDPEL